MLFLIALCLNFSAWAQDDASSNDRRFNAGIMLGFNGSQLDGDGLRGYDKLGLLAGIKSRTKLSERWNMDLDLLFSQRGSSADLNLGSTPNDGKYRIHLNYLELPLSINYQWGKINLHAGISYSRLMNASTDEAVTGYASSDFRKDDYNGLLGFTYYFKEKMGASLRFSRSAISIFDNPNKNASDLNGHSIALYFEYLFY